MKWLLKKYMAAVHIDSLVDLCKQTGIAKRTLYDRINDPQSLKLYEIRALDEVLHFDDEDIVKLTRGEI